jgi:hypothetical protein
MIPFIAVGLAYCVAVWIKIARNIGQPYPSYTFEFWDGGLLFRGKRLDGKKKMVVWGSALTAMMLAPLGYTFFLMASHARF